MNAKPIVQFSRRLTKALTKTLPRALGFLALQGLCVATAMAAPIQSPIPISEGAKSAFSNDGTTGALEYIFTNNVIPMIELLLIVGALFYCGMSLFTAIRECVREGHLGPLKHAGVLILIIVLLVGFIVFVLGKVATAFTPS